jgi:hypothetical protein
LDGSKESSIEDSLVEEAQVLLGGGREEDREGPAGKGGRIEAGSGRPPPRRRGKVSRPRESHFQKRITSKPIGFLEGRAELGHTLLILRVRLVEYWGNTRDRRFESRRGRK